MPELWRLPPLQVALLSLLALDLLLSTQLQVVPQGLLAMELLLRLD